MPGATYGTVKLKLGKKTYTMKPTLAAYEKTENRLGGLRQAIEMCSNMNIESSSYIIAAGCGIGSREQK